MDIIKYLQRINSNSLTGNKLEDLRNLITQHLYTVPFENLDVVNKVPIKLDLENIYKKIVMNHRGGFCYEINGLFNWLLNNLGYDVKMISTTFSNGKGGWYRANTHLANIVTIDGIDYLVDVGGGDLVRSPLPLSGTVNEDISGKYRIQRTDGVYYELQKYANDEWSTHYRFSTAPRKYDFFTDVCEFNQTSPESKFTQQTITTLANATGRVTISDQYLIITENGKKSKEEYATADFDHILSTHFNMQLNR
ncbi:arylamine N-acetyltransferase family protein [Bacillus solimangrovi]|uniref:Acetyltransferase n=1 Tax=Bacillus solimangrovi TaxID=1305675 RepID=A0A1E5LAI3_9BACI|nr:arylamine N-acetyltransferase [Bacillus solimangrovi]OEH91090.1 hypothetical protein BFG57_06885 [Bacillus solimangrovi]